MNFKNIARKALVLPVVLVLGCSDFLDVNDTPNNPLTVPPSTLLGTGLIGSAFANANELNRFGSTVTSYTAGAAGGPAAYDTYVLTGTDFGNQWNGELYNGSLIAYRKMIAAADEIGAKSYSGIGKIMTAYTFALTTDIWGDIPYSEALKGDEGIYRPRLDAQEDIYKGNASLEIQSLFDLVREGLADLEVVSTIVAPGAEDVVYYQGTSAANQAIQMSNWKKAGNALLIRMAITISRREPALAASIINEVLAKPDVATGQRPYIDENTENLNVKFGSAVGSQSPTHTYTNVSLFQNDMLVSTRYVDRLTALNDPRLPLFVTRPSGSYVTIDNGFRGTLPTPQTNYSKWSTVVLGNSGAGPVKLITNAGIKFMLAEAALSLGVTAAGTANSLYQAGIRASMTEAGVSTANIDAYFTANPAVVTLAGTNEEQLEQILVQKYIAMTGNGLDAWNDWRRTGHPTLLPHQNAAGEDGTRPLRARYLDAEIARNNNFADAVKKTNEPVWWDVN
jgi:hypothetical protein